MLMNANELAQEFEEYLKSIEELPWGNYEVLCDLAVTKLRQQQESIEGLTRDYDLLFAEHQLLRKKEWVGLTEEELCEIVGVSTNDSDWNVYKVQEWLRKVEAKLKEKNT
jgi:hypothetical protein